MRITNSIGPATGFELAYEAHLGKRLLRLTFIVLHQRGPVAQTMVFYMPPATTDWQLIGMDLTGEPGRFPFQSGN